MTTKYRRKTKLEGWDLYTRQAQKILLTHKNGRKFYLFNWFGLFFLVNPNLEYMPNENLRKYAQPNRVADWASLIERIGWFPEYEPKNLDIMERSAAKYIAKQLRKDPLWKLTRKERAHVLEILQKRAEHKKGEEFKERYKEYRSGDSSAPPIDTPY